MRGVSDKNILDEFCIKFCSVVEKHCKYIVVSGFVAISSGRTRATEDIDMIIEKLPIEKFKSLHSDLLKEGFVCMQSDSAEETFDYLAHNTAVRYTIENKALPEMEMKFVKDALDDYQIKTRIKLPLTGLDIWFSSIDMNVAFKEEALKSDKDLKDAEHLRKVYAEMIDESEINEIKKMIRKLR
ncbi:MAG: hypothetical protein V1734_00530 [Nanoarchaeota archaeon]